MFRIVRRAILMLCAAGLLMLSFAAGRAQAASGRACGTIGGNGFTLTIGAVGYRSCAFPRRVARAWPAASDVGRRTSVEVLGMRCKRYAGHNVTCYRGSRNVRLLFLSRE